MDARSVVPEDGAQVGGKIPIEPQRCAVPHRIFHLALAGFCAALLTTSAAVGQSPAETRSPTGFALGYGLGFSAVSFADHPDYILGGTKVRPGGWGWLRAGYRAQRVTFTVGWEWSVVNTGDGPSMGSIAMPLELDVRLHKRLGRFVPSLVLGYVRYGVGERDVPVSRLPPTGSSYAEPPDWLHRVAFIANGIRMGASLALPVSKHFMVQARPVVDLLRLGTYEYMDNYGGDMSLPNPGWSQRYAVSFGLLAVF